MHVCGVMLMHEEGARAISLPPSLQAAASQLLLLASLEALWFSSVRRGNGLSK